LLIFCDKQIGRRSRGDRRCMVLYKQYLRPLRNVQAEIKRYSSKEWTIGRVWPNHSALPRTRQHSLSGRKASVAEKTCIRDLSGYPLSHRTLVVHPFSSDHQDVKRKLALGRSIALVLRTPVYSSQVQLAAVLQHACFGQIPF